MKTRELVERNDGVDKVRSVGISVFIGEKIVQDKENCLKFQVS